MNDKHDESRLPLWVRQRLQALRMDVRILQGVAEADAVLRGKDWFILRGPEFLDTEDHRNMYVLNRNSFVQVCTLGRGDMLLIARNHERVGTCISDEAKRLDDPHEPTKEATND